MANNLVVAFDRLKEIHATGPSGTINTFTYDYDVIGQIREWTQQQGATTATLRNFAFAYDRDGQLTDAVVTDNSDSVIKTWSWQYDPAGNRLRESIDTASTYTEANELNQLLQIGGAGTTLVEGTVDELSIVMINEEQAAMYPLPGGEFLFRRTIPVNEGQNTITVEATDASENIQTNVYAVVIGGVQKTLEYDLNGNLRYERDAQDTVLREFQWDARNRLVAIIDGDNTTEFEYDGLDRRVRIVEKENGIEQSNVTFLWDGSEIIQKRNAAADTVLRNYFDDGFTEGTDSYFYTKDHLGSIREVISANGQTIESRYEYTPWGGVTRTAGTGAESDFLFTGHYYHAPSELFLTHYRQYSPELGRWLSRDLLGFMDGPNLYAYVGNNPVVFIDPLGLASVTIGGGVGVGGYITVGWEDGRVVLGGGVGLAKGAIFSYSHDDPEPRAFLDGCESQKFKGSSTSIGFKTEGSGKFGTLGVSGSIGGQVEVDGSQNFQANGFVSTEASVSAGNVDGGVGGTISVGIKGCRESLSGVLTVSGPQRSFGIGVLYFGGITASHKF